MGIHLLKVGRKMKSWELVGFFAGRGGAIWHFGFGVVFFDNHASMMRVFVQVLNVVNSIFVLQGGFDSVLIHVRGGKNVPDARRTAGKSKKMYFSDTLSRNLWNTNVRDTSRPPKPTSSALPAQKPLDGEIRYAGNQLLSVPENAMCAYFVVPLPYLCVSGPLHLPFLPCPSQPKSMPFAISSQT